MPQPLWCHQLCGAPVVRLHEVCNDTPATWYGKFPLLFSQVLTGEFVDGKPISSYFASKYCVMEFRGALCAGKSIVFVLEVLHSKSDLPVVHPTRL